MQPVTFKYQDVKSFLKQASKVISAAKQLRKLPENQKISKTLVEDILKEAHTYDDNPWKLFLFRQKIRNYHVAISEFRGKTREQIESKVREDNRPDETLIAQIKEELTKANPSKEDLKDAA